MLNQLLQAVSISYTPQILMGTEFQKEEALLMGVASSMTKRGSMFKHGPMSELTDHSELLVKNRVDAIQLIHSMKRSMPSQIVSVCGPANSGKTVLISQLLMDPRIQQLSGDELAERTTGVIVREWCPNTFIIDSPGLDAAQAELVNKFKKSSALLGTAYVYIRVWQGTEQRDDMETALNILELSDQESPHVLIVLNRVLVNREDALGRKLDRDKLLGICVRFKSELKNLVRERNLLDPTPDDSSVWEWCRTKWHEMVERRCKNVEVVLGDLRYSRDDIQSKAPDIHDIVFDAARIADWCAQVMDPDGANTKLRQHVKDVDHSRWVADCLQLEEQTEHANQGLRGS